MSDVIRLDLVRSGDAVRGWAVGHVLCRSCARRWVAVAAPLADPGHLECPGCGALEGDMSAEPQADAIPIRVARSFP